MDATVEGNLLEELKTEEVKENDKDDEIVVATNKLISPFEKLM